MNSNKKCLFDCFFFVCKISVDVEWVSLHTINITFINNTIGLLLNNNMHEQHIFIEFIRKKICKIKWEKKRYSDANGICMDKTHLMSVLEFYSFVY